MADHDALRLDSNVFKNVELLERRLSRNSRVREDRQVRFQVRPADGPEHFSLVGCHVVPGPDFAERAYGIRFDLSDQRLNDLALAHRADLFRVVRLRVEAGTRDDRHLRPHRQLTEKTDSASHVWMPAVDDAADALTPGGT